MAALNLHHAIFAERDSDLPLRSATSFLRPAPERDESPTSHLFASAAYQDLIQRQPTHPDGPTSGWDLGLNLLGDPITAAERKKSEDHRTRMKVRRLHAINTAFELLFGVWGTYASVRYGFAFVDGLGDPEHVCALVLGIMSALALTLVVTSASMPLLPQYSQPHAWRCTRLFLRACYMLLVTAGAVINLILVLIWRPSRFCYWDLDISWYTSTTDAVASPCHAAPFAAWIAAAVLRVVVTSTMTLSFVYTLCSFYGIRRPGSEGNSPRYSQYFPSDPEYSSPVSTSSPFDPISKSTFRFTRSEDSSHTLNQSNVTLPKSNSISTLAPSTSCTAHSRSHSTPATKDMSPPRISPPPSRGTSTSSYVTSHGSSQTETPPQTQPVNVVMLASSMLRQTNSISIARVTPDAMLTDVSCPERPNNSLNSRDASEIRSCTTWKPSHRGTVTQPDSRKTNSAWETSNARHVAQASVVPDSHDDGESSKEKDKDDNIVYSYGYGAPGPTYPYLDMYNPQRPSGYYPEASSPCVTVDERGPSQGLWRPIPSGPAFPDVSSEMRSSPSKEEERESSGEEEEYVAMMGGFVRRMATIESLGSKEATSTRSGSAMTTGSVARYSMRSKTPASQFSSVLFADHGSSHGSSSLGVPVGTHGSLSTAYFSFSSGGTGVRVNERGELVSGREGRGAATSSYDRPCYTGSTLPRVDDNEDP